MWLCDYQYARERSTVGQEEREQPSVPIIPVKAKQSGGKAIFAGSATSTHECSQVGDDGYPVGVKYQRYKYDAGTNTYNWRDSKHALGITDPLLLFCTKVQVTHTLSQAVAEKVHPCALPV